MTFTPSTIEAANSHRAAIAERMNTPEDWYGKSDYQNSTERPVYDWLRAEETILNPSAINMYDSVIAELYPDHREDWGSSGLRHAINKAKGERYDIIPTVEVIEGWIRNPFVWNDASSPRKNVVILNKISRPQTDHPMGARRWSTFCRALATSKFPLPNASLGYLNSEMHFGIMRSVSSFGMSVFIDAAVRTNYDELTVAPFVTPVVDATTAYKFWNALGDGYGNPLLWLAALSTQFVYDDMYNHSEMELVDSVVEMHEKNLSPEAYLRWHRMGIKPEQMLEFSLHGIDEQIIISMFARAPGEQ